VTIAILLNCYIAKLAKQKRQFNNLTIQQLSFGFTLIELLIVISLMGLAGSLVTTYYLTFERGQRLKNAALTLKNDVRYVQNKALSGDKGVPGAGGCVSPSILGGWYLEFSTGSNTSYRYAGDCLSGAAEADFNSKPVNLPDGIRITRLNYGSDRSEVNILFRPLAQGVEFFGIMGSVDFFDNTNPQILNSPITSSNDLIIELTSSGMAKYQVIVKPSGEVNEKKI